MFDLPLDLSQTRILVTNDDGIHAQGLKVLESIARSLSDDVWVVAPEMEQSAASHSLTINRPLRLRKLDERRFTVDGTPTDCVLLAVNHVMKDARPTLVLSGVNQGSNIGEDVTYSGTIAAAMEATLLNVPAIAMSQHYETGQPIDWSAAEAYGAEVVRKAVTVAWPKNVLLNVNFPARPAAEVTGMRVVRHGKRKIGDELLERVDPRGKPYIWIGTLRGEADVADDTDIHVVFNGGISITPVFLDLTHTPTLQTLRQAFV
ncbi:5'/3'-nucleotidase SurE [Azospirillum sp. TSO35-2]|uniref:5'/3'-nucleotidase SurE n=1 Tax=Azospirillum sp. TSO35-2 TaxID=716796 RepID=UPI000D61B4E5|nr:5'/3'-nucleotidase SurE [Azospirillum sp. TSO35-2]PWC32417.1 stationary phase survival protein SurE [Azospirillum sp. TSO35-2]